MRCETIEQLKEWLPKPSSVAIGKLLNISSKEIDYRMHKPKIGEIYTRNFVNYDELFPYLKWFDYEDIIKLNKEENKINMFNLKKAINSGVQFLYNAQEIKLKLISASGVNCLMVKYNFICDMSVDYYCSINHLLKLCKNGSVTYTK